MPGKGNAFGQKGQGLRGGPHQGPQGSGRGRSELSPGHLKRQAGEQSARDFAPGHAATKGGDTELPEAGLDEMSRD